MADSSAIAFGRYLRMLRERRGLSLEEVASLSRAFADSVGKSYLSRCENGRVRLALSKMIPLSRVYEVPPEVLVERLELDMELEKIGAPETKGKNFGELTAAGKDATIRGDYWQAYGYLRDAVRNATTSSLNPGFRDLTEQFLRSCINLSSAAANLGRPRLALHELEFVHRSEGLSPQSLPILYERIARTNRALQRFAEARRFADLAVTKGEAVQLTPYMGYFYATRAHIAKEEGDASFAIKMYQMAFRSFRDAGHRHECTTALLNLAQVYFDRHRYAAARRALASAERIARSLHQDRARALARLLLGEIDERESQPERAKAHWREASRIARSLSDRTLRFKADFLLYRHAVANRDELVAMSIERRLKRASCWIREPLEEVDAFHRISGARARVYRTDVASSQRRQQLRSNVPLPTSLI